MNNNRGVAHILVIFLVIVLIAGVGYLALNGNVLNKIQEPDNTSSNTPIPSSNLALNLAYFDENGVPLQFTHPNSNGLTNDRWTYYSQSPNNKWLLVDPDYNGKSISRQVSVYSVDENNINEHSTFTLSGLVSVPSITNDGQTIIYAKGCIGDIYTQKHGEEEIKLSAQSNWYYGAGGSEECGPDEPSGPIPVDISSDSNYLMYSRDNTDTGNYDLLSFSLAENKEILIASNDVSTEHKVWHGVSPTDNQFSYTSHVSGVTNIDTYNPISGKVSQITNYQDNNVQGVDWSQDGKALFVVRYTDANTTLEKYNLADNSTETLAIPELEDFRLGVLDIKTMSNGDVLLLAYSDNTHRWFIVSNDLISVEELSVNPTQLVTL